MTFGRVSGSDVDPDPVEKPGSGPRSLSESVLIKASSGSGKCHPEYATLALQNVLCVKEVVTHFILLAYFIKWATTSWTYCRVMNICLV